MSASSRSRRRRNAGRCLKLLLGSLVSRGAPAYVAVATSDTQGLADALKEHGFTQLPSEGNADIYRLEPPASAAKAA